jgi:hypothetical protein
MVLRTHLNRDHEIGRAEGVFANFSSEIDGGIAATRQFLGHSSGAVHAYLVQSAALQACRRRYTRVPHEVHISLSPLLHQMIKN